MKTCNNVINLTNPSEYYCHVENYAIGHKEMAIAVSHRTRKSERFYLFFYGVICFSGMLRWEGALLRIASDPEYLEFIGTMMSASGIPEEQLLDKDRYGYLYVFEAEKRQVRLVAGHMERRQTLWQMS